MFLSNTRHNPCFYMTDIRFLLSCTCENVYKHCRCSVDGRALLLRDGVHAGGAVEAGAGNHVGGTVNHSGQSSSHVTETVVKWNRNTNTMRLQKMF